MPVMDCEEYCRPALSIALGDLKHELQEAGQDPARQNIAYVNVYFGVEELGLNSGYPWHVCIPRDHGFLAVVFHFVRHGDVVKSSVTQVANRKGLCVTLLWTTKDNVAAELADALKAADNVVAQAEMLLGRPIPLPLRSGQLPDRFGVRTIAPDAAHNGQEKIELVFLEGSHANMLRPQEVTQIRALALEPLSDYFDTPLKQAMHLSAKWQRRAIRAGGTEDWAALVVASNTWIETLLVRSAILLEHAAGSPIRDGARELRRKSFVQFASRHLGQRLSGAKWDPKDEDAAFGKWHRDCYLLRNKVVHEGHFPSADEAKLAYAVSNGLAWYVTRQAAEIRDPKLAEFLSPFRNAVRFAKSRSP